MLLQLELRVIRLNPNLLAVLFCHIIIPSVAKTSGKPLGAKVGKKQGEGENDIDLIINVGESTRAQSSVAVPYHGGSAAAGRPGHQTAPRRHLLLLYVHPYPVSTKSIPLLQQLAEYFRYGIALALLPAIAYKTSWLLPKFLSIVAHVFFVCINCNLMLTRAPNDFKMITVHLLVLGYAVIILIEDILDGEQKERDAIKKAAIEKRNSAKVVVEKEEKKKEEKKVEMKVEKKEVVQEKKEVNNRFMDRKKVA